jgi:quercetin dioxygenase-like cupin family protein
VAQEHAEPGIVIDLNTFGEMASTAVVKEKEFEAIRIYLSPGKKIPPHKVDGPITVHCLSGKCTFFVKDEPRSLAPGFWLYLEGGTMHSLQAEEECTVLVTILFDKSD